MAIAAVVLLVEASAGGFGVAGEIVGAADGNRNRMLLPAIPQVGGEVEAAAREMIAER